MELPEDTIEEEAKEVLETAICKASQEVRERCAREQREVQKANLIREGVAEVPPYSWQLQWDGGARVLVQAGARQFTPVARLKLPRYPGRCGQGWESRPVQSLDLSSPDECHARANGLPLGNRQLPMLGFTNLVT